MVAVSLEHNSGRFNPSADCPRAARMLSRAPIASTPQVSAMHSPLSSSQFPSSAVRFLPSAMSARIHAAHFPTVAMSSTRHGIRYSTSPRSSGTNAATPGSYTKGSNTAARHSPQASAPAHRGTFPSVMHAIPAYMNFNPAQRTRSNARVE